MTGVLPRLLLGFEKDHTMHNIYDQDLPRNTANFTALSPLSFIERTAEVYPDLSLIHI